MKKTNFDSYLEKQLKDKEFTKCFRKAGKNLGTRFMKRQADSKVFKELRQIRDELLAEEKRVGSDTFWAEVSRQGEKFARKHGLKRAKSPAKVSAVAEARAKYGKR